MKSKLLKGLIYNNKWLCTMQLKHSVLTHHDFYIIPGKCPRGTRYNGGVCLPCPEHHYQDLEGQMECKKCPAGRGSVSLRSKTIDDCKGSEILFMILIIEHLAMGLLRANILYYRGKLSWEF